MTFPTALADPPTVQPRSDDAAASWASDPASPVGLYYNLAEGGSFLQSIDRPHLSVLIAFGGDRLHQFGVRGAWDLDRAISENSAALFRSVRQNFPEGKNKKWNHLTFRFGPREFLYADDVRIVGYATTPLRAEQMVAKFDKAYRTPVGIGGEFYLITANREIESVPLGADTILAEDTYSLHYPDGGLEWHQNFIKILRAKSHGLSIFEGTPGTGKTSYLRHLMGKLKETHRFYFIPTAAMAVLSDPEFVAFWANQRRNHAHHQFVVILEDADAALMTRGSENRELVSAILNLSDGMLGDFLRLQIICTINCRAADIDQALLRPGRLLCHRVFQRLNHAEATRLAESLGRVLTTVADYSLAEIFADHESVAPNRPPMGFAAAAKNPSQP